MSAGDHWYYDELAKPKRRPGSTRTLCYDLPLRTEPRFNAQVVLPDNMTTDEAKRLCTFVESLVIDAFPAPAGRELRSMT
jgi:hypothetical protein